MIPQVHNTANSWTSTQFADRFGPTEQDYQDLIAFAKKNGFIIAATHPNRMLLDVRGPVPVVEHAHSTCTCTSFNCIPLKNVNSFLLMPHLHWISGCLSLASAAWDNFSHSRARILISLPINAIGTAQFPHRFRPWRDFHGL